MVESRKGIRDLLMRYNRGVRRVVVGQVKKGRNVPVRCLLENRYP